MHKHVEVLIGRLATNPALRSRFAERPSEVLREQGLELTEVEIAALAGTDPDAFRALAAALDARLLKASLAVERRPTSGETTNRNELESDKETER